MSNFKSACEQSNYISKVAGIANRGGVTSLNRNEEETVPEADNRSNPMRSERKTTGDLATQTRLLILKEFSWCDRD